MTDNCTVIRHNERIPINTLRQRQEWKERYQRVKLSYMGMWERPVTSVLPWAVGI